MGWPDISWVTNELINVENMDEWQEADVYVKDRILDHVHDDTAASVKIIKASRDDQGSVFYYTKQTAQLSASGGTETVPLTDDGTSGGNNLFADTLVPFVWVQRSKDHSGDGSCLHVGHNTNGAKNYYSRVSWNATNGYWEVFVKNHDSSARSFVVVAIGTD